ncbi:MAG: hypothetical protein K0S93_86 [Nitrososphaeraceae archaeon]|jgi:hypothetical protein|nr:hypothetical protein [Nitrososphaeraceae archaeon]
MIDVKGCGCRYREINDSTFTNCEHLCENHEKEFILRLFNWQHGLKQEKEVGGGYISID